MPSDPDLLRKNLRIDTCRLLKYDINALTAAQEVRLARATILRLELDDIETRKIHNQNFDAAKYILISESLERLVGGNPDGQQTTGQPDFSGARQELLTFLENRAVALEHKAERQRAEAETKQATAPVDSTPPQEPPSPAVELMPADQEPPPPRPPVTYVDSAVVADIDEPNPLRHSSMNMPTVRPTPRAQQPQSQVTQSYFSNAPGGSGRTGFRRFDPPRGW